MTTRNMINIKKNVLKLRLQIEQLQALLNSALSKPDLKTLRRMENHKQKIVENRELIKKLKIRERTSFM